MNNVGKEARRFGTWQTKYSKINAESSKGKGREAASVQMYKETFVHSIDDEQGKVFSETTDDYPSSKNSIPIDESRSSSDSERQLDVIVRGERDKNNYSDTHISGTKSISSSTRRSSSSSSLESTSNDFFRMEEAFKFTESSTSTLASKSGKDYVCSSGSSAKSEVDNSSLGPSSTSQVCDLTGSQKGMSPTASPPMQVMDRSGRYDPSRIPSSVFDRSTNPSEWSIASNDSLFSIQIGQPSFSREKASMYDELRVSRELTKSGELDMHNRAPSVILEEIDTTRKSGDIENHQTMTASHEASKLEEERLTEDCNETKTLHQTASYESSKSKESSLSQRSGTSVHSGASPSKKRLRTFCYCSNCSWVFCYCKLPTCCKLWPSGKCSNCCGVFCCCWNNRTNHYDHASPILTETKRNDSSMKADIPRQQSDKEESEAVSNSTSGCCNCFQSKQASEVSSNSNSNCCNWFRCFSCPSCTWKLSCSTCSCCG